MKLFDNYTSYANPFDVFGKCYKPPNNAKPAAANSKFQLYESQGQESTASADVLKAEPARNDLPCIWHMPMVQYYNSETVKKQLNIMPAYMTEEWIACKNHPPGELNYTYNETGVAWAYQALRGKGYKILKYSGDTDAIIPTLGT